MHEWSTTEAKAFWLAYFEVGQTEPLTVSELAKAFNLDRRKMAAIVERMPGADRDGYFWRVPVARMPPRWIAEKLAEIASDNCAHFWACRSDGDRATRGQCGGSS